MRMLVRLQDKGTIINIDTNGDKEMFENFCISLPKGEYERARMTINSGSSEQFNYLIKTREGIGYALKRTYEDTVDMVFLSPYIVNKKDSDITIDVLPDMNITLVFV